MIVSLPYPPARYDAEAARQLVDQLVRAFGLVLSTETTSPWALLSAPDGSVWKVTVNNAGALTTVRVPLGTPL